MQENYPNCDLELRRTNDTRASVVFVDLLASCTRAVRWSRCLRNGGVWMRPLAPCHILSSSDKDGTIILALNFRFCASTEKLTTKLCGLQLRPKVDDETFFS